MIGGLLKPHTPGDIYEYNSKERSPNIHEKNSRYNMMTPLIPN